MSQYAAESGRLWLQSLSIDEHLQDYHLLMANEKARLWSVHPTSTSLEDSRQIMATRVATTEKPWVESYAILLKDSVSDFTGLPRVIGSIGTASNEPAGVEIGYGLHPDFWDKGYMREALGMFIEIYWGPGREASRETIIAAIDPENLGSERVAKRLGFTRGEVLKGCYQRASDIRAGVIEKRNQTRWYLHRPKKGIWERYDINNATKAPE